MEKITLNYFTHKFNMIILKVFFMNVLKYFRPFKCMCNTHLLTIIYTVYFIH